jgi:hypothetical protein
MNKNRISEYISCQKFIVKSELSYHWFNMKLNIAQSEFIEKTVDCIFNSLEKIAEEIETKNSNEDIREG